MAPQKLWYVVSEEPPEVLFNTAMVNYSLIPITSKQAFDLKVLDKKIEKFQNEIAPLRYKGKDPKWDAIFMGELGELENERKRILYGPEEKRETRSDPTYNLTVRFPANKNKPFQQNTVIRQSDIEKLKSFKLEPNVPQVRRPAKAKAVR